MYAKLVVNDAQANAAVVRLRQRRPPAGLVQALKVTEKQFAGMEFRTGSRRCLQRARHVRGVRGAMKLTLSGFPEALDLGSDAVSVLEIHNRTLFSRVCQSLFSELDDEALEPYAFWDDD